MPTFPTYPGKLPKCLNPFNWRHYLLVLYWVFFRPTALKCYLYQADPELYRGESGKGIGSALALPAYRNLLIVALGATVLISCSIRASVLLLQGHTVEYVIVWGWFFIWWSFVVLTTMVFALLMVVTNGVVYGVAMGIVSVVGFGFILSVLGLGIAGVVFTVALGWAVGPVGIISNDFIRIWSAGVVGSLIGVLSRDFTGDVLSQVLIIVAVMAGFLRLPIFVLQGGGLLRAPWRGFHPIWWDELAVLPFMQSEVAIAQAWRSGEEDGLRRLSQLTANPFQRWVVQRALIRRLHDSAAPIHFLYRLFQIKELDAYAVAPLAVKDWQRIPSVLQIYLNELAGIEDVADTFVDKWVRSLTQPLRIKHLSPLIDLTGILMLYHLAQSIVSREYVAHSIISENNLKLNDLLNRIELRKQDIEQAIEPDPFLPLFQSLLAYPGGEELQHSFGCMASCLRATSLAELANGESWFMGMPAAKAAIRPPVIEALERFAGIRQDIAVSEVASSRVNQLAALGRAIEGLEDLRVFITREVWSPEQVLLQTILKRWRSLVSGASGRLGQQVVSQPVANPYVAGNPVTGRLFVGRDDILRELEELWLSRGQVDSVVLFGHRRMGKSSILKNLPARLDPTYNRVVQFNLQQIGRVRNTGELLHALALEMRDHLPANGPPSPAVPDQETFEANANRAFSGWLKAIAPLMVQQRFIVAIDEYELLEAAIAEGRIDASLTTYLRSVIQSTDWFVLVLAGLYTLEEKCHDYWHPLFASIKPRKVSFLSPAATRLLLCQPSEDFPLNYAADTVEEVVRLSNGQPYLVQLIGQNLVTRFNRQVFELGQDPERPISLDDLQAVIDSPDFFQDGSPYFKGIWMQAADHPLGQQAILKALAQESKDLQQLAAETGLSEDVAKEALSTLA
ncbi:MAG: ATP-binding protein, partial [Cyanobacteria bacterium]|nr:ATP-binding protein [Cyanobacteriota bacterium]